MCCLSSDGRNCDLIHQWGREPQARLGRKQPSLDPRAGRGRRKDAQGLFIPLCTSILHDLRPVEARCWDEPVEMEPGRFGKKESRTYPGAQLRNKENGVWLPGNLGVPPEADDRAFETEA